MNQVADEIQQFIDQFIPTGPSETEKKARIYWECFFCEMHNPAEEEVCGRCSRMSHGAEMFEADEDDPA